MALPCFNLRLIIDDKRPSKERWREAQVQLWIAEAARELASVSRLPGIDAGTYVRGDKFDVAAEAADAALIKAQQRIMAVPAPTRDALAVKRKIATPYKLGKHPEWQIYIDEDDARLPRKSRA